jgi:WD40 repeat protein
MCRLTLQGHTTSVTACAWSPDGTRIVSGSDDNSLKVWDAATGECLSTGHQLPEHQTAAIDEQTGRVMSASPEAWRWLGWMVTDPKTGEVRRLPIHAGGAYQETAE